jgi:hypothetical protein
MKRKLAVFDSGFHQKTAFNTLDHPFTLLSINKLKGTTFFFYDVIVITNFIDQYALANIKSDLKRFLKRKGILVIFGATDLNSLGWIPYCQWNGTGKWPVECNIVPSVDTHYIKILNKLVSLDDFKYHSTYTGHGTLDINNPDSTFHILLTAEKNRVIMFVRDHPQLGKILVTTLDPDYHSIPQTPGPSNKETPDTVRAARQLLNNVINWSMAESMQKTNIWRRLEGVLRKSTAIIFGGILFSVPAIIIYLWKPSTKPFLDDIYQYLGSMTIWITLIDYIRSFIFKHKISS